MVRGQVLTGVNSIAGEWGHNPLPRQEEEGALRPPVCYCGRHGCVETWLSGPALAGDHLRQSGENLSCEEIARRAQQGDAGCEATLLRYEKRLAKALAQVINLLDPEVIVLGGGLSGLERLYGNVPRYWAAHVFSNDIATRLSPPRHGDSSGVRGAAWLWNVR